MGFIFRIHTKMGDNEPNPKKSWWLNQPIWKIRVKLDHLPQVKVKMKNLWNHHPANHKWSLRFPSHFWVNSPTPRRSAFDKKLLISSVTFRSEDQITGFWFSNGEQRIHHHFKMVAWTRISYVKIWFIIQLKQPFVNGCFRLQKYMISIM